MESYVHIPCIGDGICQKKVLVKNMFRDKEKYNARFSQYHTDDPVDIFLDDATEVRNATNNLPEQLADALPPDMSYKLFHDGVNAAADRLEEQSLALRSEGGARTAVSLKRAREQQEDVDEEEQEEEDEQHAALATVPMEEVPPIQDFSEYEFPEDTNDVDNQALARRMQQLNETHAHPEHTAVPIESTLRYVFSLKDEMQGGYLRASQRQLIQHGITSWEKIPVCKRAYMRAFWRECDPGVKWERPCSRAECESVRVGQFRCREFFADASVWAEVVSTRGASLTPTVGWCLHCHLLMSGRLFLAALNRFMRDPEGKDMNKIYRVHDFAVEVDVVGEYRLSRTLIEQDLPREIYAKLKNRQLPFVGMFGLFPIYNVHNYTPVKITTPSGAVVRGWRESDDLVFRLAQTVSETSKSCPTTLGGQAKPLLQSGPTTQPARFTRQ